MNLFGTMERMCFALGVPRLDDIAERVQEVIEPEIPTNFLEKLKMLPKLARLADFVPKTVSSAPCQEVVEKDHPSLSFLPVVKTWPGDGGPFITLPLECTGTFTRGGRSITGDSGGRGNGCPLRSPSAAIRRRSTRPPRRCPRIWTR
jgi:4-hydroxy-3-polyprenylbenzoate decarboxylase